MARKIAPGLVRSTQAHRDLILQINLVARGGDDGAVLGSKAAHQRRTDHAAMPGDPALLTGERVGGHVSLLHDGCCLHDLEIVGDHLVAQIAHRGLVRPTETGVRLGRIADQKLDLGRAEIARIDFDTILAGRPIPALLLDAPALPLKRDADVLEGPFDEFAHFRGLAGGKLVVVGLVLLQHQPNTAPVFAGVTPVAKSVEIAEIELLLLA